MKKAQASLEATLSLLCAAILLMAGFRTYIWVSQRLVERQEHYEHSPDDLNIEGKKYGAAFTTGRVQAAESATRNNPYVVEESALQPLRILGEDN